MAARTLKFRAIAQWAIEAAEAKIRDQTSASTSVSYIARVPNEGRLTIKAANREEAEKAAKLITNDRTLGKLFEE